MKGDLNWWKANCVNCSNRRWRWWRIWGQLNGGLAVAGHGLIHVVGGYVGVAVQGQGGDVGIAVHGQGGVVGTVHGESGDVTVAATISRCARTKTISCGQ